MIVLILQLWAAILICGIIGLIFLKLRNWGKITAVILKPSRKYSGQAVKTEGTKLKITKDWQPNFTPLSIFDEEKSPLSFWRSAKKIVLITENSNQAVAWKQDEKGGELKPSDLMYHWSIDEIKEYIKKLAKKAAVDSKPLSNNMFLLLLISSVGSLMLLLLIALRIGVF